MHGARAGQLTRGLWLAGMLLAVCAHAETGVEPNLIVLGERSAFSGPSAGLGVEVWRGEQAAFSEINDAGGIHGRKIKLVLTDDGYDAERAAPAALKLITKEKVFALFGGVGTPTIVKVLPVLLKYHSGEGLFQFSNFTGAQPQREPPYAPAVFNVRASYRQETRAMVDAFVKMGRKKIGIFVQDDAYGSSGRDGVKLALKAHGLELAADTTYPRGQTFDVSTQGQVQALKEAGVDAVISVGAYQACAGMIRDLRTSGSDVPVHNVSFVGADQMLGLLKKADPSGKQLKNLLVTQVVPPYTDTSVPLVKAYRAALQRYKPVSPAGLGDNSYRPAGEVPSFGSLEGYINAKAFAAVLQKAGKDLTRKSFVAAAEGMGTFDLGLGAPLEFSPARRQALDKVWFTYATDQGWVATSNPASILR